MLFAPAPSLRRFLQDLWCTNVVQTRRVTHRFGDMRQLANLTVVTGCFRGGNTLSRYHFFYPRDATLSGPMRSALNVCNAAAGRRTGARVRGVTLRARWLLVAQVLPRSI